MLASPLRHVVLFLFFGLLIACGGGGSGSSIDDGGSPVGGGPVDSTAPSVTSQTPDRLMAQSAIITVVFSESMDTSSLTLGGDLAAESNGGIWSNTANDNDTLSFNPATSWSANTNQKLIINARDLAGNSLPALTLTHDVYRGTLIYMSTTALPYNSGDGLTPATAKRTFEDAINATSGEATIAVHSGFYVVSGPSAGLVEGTSERIMLPAGVSLYGGYYNDFLERDPTDHASLILDSTSNTVDSYALQVMSGVTSTSLIDGFIVQGSDSTTVANSRAIFIESLATPIIQNNTLHGGAGTTSASGIYVFQSIPNIHNNTIYGGGTVAGSTTNSYGINIRAVLGATQPVIRNNTIHGGYGDNNSIAIRIEDASPAIDNNIILTRPDFGAADTGTICIQEIFPAGVSSTPTSLRNNALFNCETLYFDNESGCSGSQSCTSIDDVNGFLDVSNGASANIVNDALFADIDGIDDDIYTFFTIRNDFFALENDWHFSASSPVSVRTGGLNGVDQGWSFTTDKDGVIRPVTGSPWTIGAYD